MRLTKQAQAGQVTWLGVGQPKTVLAQPVAALTLTWDGIAQDRHRGRTRYSLAWEKFLPFGSEVLNLRQVSLVSAEELAQVADRMGVARLEPGWLGANLMVAGLAEFSHIRPGSLLRLGAADDEAAPALLVTGQNDPCRKPVGLLGAVLPEGEREQAKLFAKAAYGLRGLLAITVKQGEIGVGAPVQVWAPLEIEPR